MSKLTLFGKLYKVDFKGLHNVYYECYGNNSGALHDLEKYYTHVKDEINIMLNNYPIYNK